MSAAPTSEPASKLLGLELLRFVAAVSVLIWHYQHFSYVADAPAGLVKSQLPFYGLLGSFYTAGENGVRVFWCISGFIFFWKYRDQIHDRAVSGWRFFVFRLSRLYPLHIVTLLTVALLQSVYVRMHGYAFVYQDNDVPHFLLQLILASDWASEHRHSFNGPIWSISIEVLVYIVFFLGARYVTRSAWLNVAVIVICLNFSGQVFSCFVYFYAGGLAAMARRALERTRFLSRIETVAGIVTVGSSFWICQLQTSGGLIHGFFFLIVTPVLLICLSRDFHLPPSVEKIILAAGNMTYSSYLLHFPVQLAIAVGFAAAQQPMPYAETWFFLAFIGTTLAASLLTFQNFEMPAQRYLRDRLLPHRRSQASALRPATGPAI